MQEKDGGLGCGIGGARKLETAMTFDFPLAGKYSGYELICRTDSVDGLMPPVLGIVVQSIDEFSDPRV